MTHYPVTHDGASLWVFSVQCDRERVLWLGTQEHGVHRFTGKALERVRFSG